MREVSRMLADAGIRHALVGALGANAIDSGADREHLRVAVKKATPHCADALERLFKNVDRSR